MKHTLFDRPWRPAGQISAALGLTVTAVMCASLLLAPARLNAQSIANGVVVDTLSGGGYFPYYGYVNGNTANAAQFHTPLGLAMDSTGNYLFVADSDNHAVRRLNLSANQTVTFLPNVATPSGAINKPLAVAVATDNSVYVLNQGTGNNGTLLVFRSNGILAGTNAAGLVNASSLTLDSATNAYVTAGNSLLRITPAGVRTTLATIPGASLQGVAVMDNGLIAVCDSAFHGIYLINPTNGVSSNLTGFNGAGDNTWWDSAFGMFGANEGVPKELVQFNQPYGLAKAGGGILVVSDYGNNRVKVVDAEGTVTNLYGVTSSLWFGQWPGWADGNVTVPDAWGDVEARQPRGVLLAPNGLVYVTETYYHLIRTVTGANLPPVPPPPPPPPAAPTILIVRTNLGQVFLAWSGVAGASSYNVKRSPSDGGPYTIVGNTSATNYTDATVLNGTTYYYVVSSLSTAGGESANSGQVRAITPLPPVRDPSIGWVEFPPPLGVSVMHPVSEFVLNNDVPVVIAGQDGSQTFYTWGATGDNISNPTNTSASAPLGYNDGLGDVSGYRIDHVLPDVTFKAIGMKTNCPSSAIVTARFHYITGNPLITGNNAAQFSVSDITAGAQMWYTVNGTDPTNGPPSIGPISSGTTLSLQFPPGVDTITFKVRAFRPNYQASAIVPATFSATNFIPNSLSFGFASGEASSDFIGSSGQTFYAPVTLSPLPGTMIYSLQFNLAVTNAGPNPGPSVEPGAFHFQSFLEKPIPGTTPVLYERIPPLMFGAYASDPPPADQIRIFDGLEFVNMMFTNSSLNLLGLGWLERKGQTNLYNTTMQTLISYSQAHDTLFTPADGKVVVGGYAFRIPAAAANNQTYRIQIDRPSATSDGIGAPGSDVYIATPTHGSLTAGAVNAIKHVTVGQKKYLAGDCAPFRWFNAGDFGNTNLDNSDVQQVFQSAIYHLNNPPPNSDFFDGMDSCGGSYVDLGRGYLEFNSYVSGPSALNPLFDGNDTCINQIAFGDGALDVCDIYVTFRRSLDPSLSWFRRFWTNGVRAAEAVSPQGSSFVLKGDKQTPKSNLVNLTNAPTVNYTAGDVIAGPGQTVQIPITARIFGDYPLRVLMLNLSVVPLDGSPALTSHVQFTPSAALGAPGMSASTGNGNYAATWLNSAVAGLSGSATVGTLSVTIPAAASSSAAYAIHFDHASGSPNGIAAFSKQVLTGLITLSSRSTSSYNDAIPDSWRLRWFGTIYNALSAASADACGDGISNWRKYVAGTDPTDPTAYPCLKSVAPAPAGASAAIHWPSVSGKQYVIERSTSLFPGSWTALTTVTGTGTEMQFDDHSAIQAAFYRVRIMP